MRAKCGGVRVCWGGGWQLATLGAGWQLVCKGHRGARAASRSARVVTRRQLYISALRAVFLIVVCETLPFVDPQAGGAPRRRLGPGERGGLAAD